MGSITRLQADETRVCSFRSEESCVEVSAHGDLAEGLTMEEVDVWPKEEVWHEVYSCEAMSLKAITRVLQRLGVNCEQVKVTFDSYV